MRDEPQGAHAERLLHLAIAEACLSVRGGDRIAHDVATFLEDRGVAKDDIEAIVAASPRLAVYRSLVRNGLGAIVVRMMPRTRKRLNAVQGGRFEVDLATFVDEIGPRTHYLRDVPTEFFTWAGPRWRADGTVPAYLADLAAYELTAFHVAAAASARAHETAAEVALDRPLAFVESARLQQFEWAVHEWFEDTEVAPVQRDVRILAYRDEAHAVRWLDLTPLAASLLDRLLAGDPLGDAVKSAFAKHEATMSAGLSDVAQLLADLGRRGVVLGARLSVEGT